MRLHNPNIKKRDIIVDGHITLAQRYDCTWAVIAQDGEVEKLIALFIDPSEAVCYAETLGLTRIINLSTR